MKTVQSSISIFKMALIVYVLSFFVIPQSFAQQEIVKTYFFDAPVVSYDSASRYSEVYINGLMNDAPEGEPKLPYQAVEIDLPAWVDSLEELNVSVEGSGVDVLKVKPWIEPGEQVQSLSDYKTVKLQPNRAIYRSSDPYPEELFQRDAVNILKNGKRNILVLRLHPVMYYPKLKQVEYFQQMTVKVSFNEASVVSDEEGLAPAALKDSDMLTASLLDPDEEYDFVIITNTDLQEEFQRLAEHRSRNGVETKVYTIEEIEQQYSGDNGLEFIDGASWETQEDKTRSVQIRNFIRDAYDAWGIEYVLLGGDVEIIPAFRIIGSSEGLAPTWVPTDLYYGGLDNEWEYTPGTHAQQLDVYAEVYVGRTPVNTAEEAKNFVDKTIQHDNPKAYYGNILGAAEDLGGGEFKTRGLVDGMIQRISADNEGYTADRLYDYGVGIIGTNRMAIINWSGESLLEGFVQPSDKPDYFFKDDYLSGEGLNSNKYHFVFHFGHSSPRNNIRLATSDFIDDYPDDETLFNLDNLVNTEPFIVYSLGCYGGSFDGWDRHETDNNGKTVDGDCVGEKFVSRPYGAVAYIGSSREGNSITDIYALSFADHVNATDPLGKIVHLTVRDVLKDHISDAEYVWAGMELNLLGDPTLMVEGIPDVIMDDPVACLLSDCNADGTTNVDDFILLKQAYGQDDCSDLNGWCGYTDINRDGVVNLSDFIMLKQNYGSSTGECVQQ